LLGACFILIQDALKDGQDGSPPANMRRALIFSCVLCAVVAPLPMSIGLFGRIVRRRRLEVDRGVELDVSEVSPQNTGAVAPEGGVSPIHSGSVLEDSTYKKV
jgi:hypothetical protein